MKTRRLAHFRWQRIALACIAAFACDGEPQTSEAPASPLTDVSAAPKSQSSENATPNSDLEAESFQAQLEALGYVTTVEIAESDLLSSGVVRHQRGAASPGLNLFNFRDEAEARLMTLDGHVVHRWHSDLQGSMVARFTQAMPLAPVDFFEGWNHIELLPGGDLLVIGSHHMLMRLDWNSKLLWKLDLAAHHDVALDPNSVIYVLVDKLRRATVEGQEVAFQDNLIVKVSADGKILGHLSLYDALRDMPLRDTKLLRLHGQQTRKLSAGLRPKPEDSPYKNLYRAAIRGEHSEHAELMNLIFHNLPEDIFHANSLEVVSDATPGWNKGDYLVSILRLDTVVLIDKETERVKWSWGPGELEKPHHATQLSNGDVLIFDNGSKRKWSRIVRLDPTHNQIIWSYQSEPKEDFYSRSRGGAQLLDNGNVLITETNSGRVFEVTPAGERVWEYLSKVNPKQDGPARRAVIYRMTRLHRDQIKILAPRLASPPNEAARELEKTFAPVGD